MNFVDTSVLVAIVAIAVGRCRCRPTSFRLV
jgi:hypothetical protein